MNDNRAYGDERRLTEAADWIVRLQAPDLGESDALAFDAWIADAANAAAYDAALTTWDAYGASPAPIAKALSERRTLPPRRWVLAGGAAAAAAAAAVALLSPGSTPQPSAQLYATGKGERRTVRLADGSTVELNATTRLSVTLAAKTRHVWLEQGQAVFDVASDAGRPFVVAVGDRTVRVVGTQFDVRRRDGRVAVTVARGSVEVSPVAGARGGAYRLRPGQRLDHREGATDVDVSQISPAEVLGWRAGRLVYRDSPLSEVVADLNQQFPTQIRIEDPALAATPISGVLVLDSQEAVIGRLALLVPIRAVRSGQGLVLRRD